MPVISDMHKRHLISIPSIASLDPGGTFVFVSNITSVSTLNPDGHVVPVFVSEGLERENLREKLVPKLVNMSDFAETIFYPLLNL